MESFVLNKILLISLFLFTSLSFSNDYTQTKTWFGDPDLQGVWTNASLTSLERPDYFESLEISDEQVELAKSILRNSRSTDCASLPLGTEPRTLVFFLGP